MHQMKFAVEIEVGHDNHPHEKNEEANFAWENDGSVHSRRTHSSSEFKTIKPYKNTAQEIRKFKNDVEALFAAIEPVSLNKSMGMHVHVSFSEPDDYARVFTYDFVTAFQKWVQPKVPKYRTTGQWAKFYDNINDFANRTRIGMTASGKCGARYRAVNYNSFVLYKTVEFRIFPARKPKNLIRYVVGLLDFIERYLDEHPDIPKGEIKTDVVEATDINISEDAKKRIYVRVLENGVY